MYSQMFFLSPGMIALGVTGGGESLWEGAQAPICLGPLRATGLDQTQDSLKPQDVGGWGYLS